MPAETLLDGDGAGVTLPGALNWEPRGSRHLGSGGGAPATLFQDAWVQVPAPLVPSCVTMGRLLSLSVFLQPSNLSLLQFLPLYLGALQHVASFIGCRGFSLVVACRL